MIFGIFLLITFILSDTISASSSKPNIKVTLIEIIPNKYKDRYLPGETIQFQITVKNSGKADGKFNLDLHVDEYKSMSIGRKKLVCTEVTGFECTALWGTIRFSDCNNALLKAGETRTCTSNSVKIAKDAEVKRYKIYATPHLFISEKHMKGATKTKFMYVYAEAPNPKVNLIFPTGDKTLNVGGYCRSQSNTTQRWW